MIDALRTAIVRFLDNRHCSLCVSASLIHVFMRRASIGISDMEGPVILAVVVHLILVASLSRGRAYGRP